MFDDFDLGVLRTVVHIFYPRIEVPALSKLEQNFNDSGYLQNGSSPTLSRLLSNVEFRYRKRPRNAFLVEAQKYYSVALQELAPDEKISLTRGAIYWTNETRVKAGRTKTGKRDNTAVPNSS